MAPYVAHRPDGRPVIFRIKGEKPSAAETERINSYLTAGPPQTSTEAEPPKEEATGVLSVLGRTVMRGANEVQAGVDTIMQSAFEGMGDLERAKEWEQAAQEQRAERDTYAAPEGSFLDSNTNKAHAIAGAIGQSAPSMGLGLAGMYAGGAAGSIFGPVGTLVGGAIGGAAGYLPQMLNANAERQIAEHGTVKDWKKAYVSSAIGAGVETITDKIGLRVLGVLADGAKLTGKALTRTTEKAVRDASKNAVDKAMTVVAKKMGTGVALSAVTGATEEVIQANLERWQAELPLMDDAAKAEYLESAIMGGIVESIFGGGAGAVGAHKQIKDTKALQAAKDDHDAEVAKLSAAAKHGEQYEQKRNAPYNEVPPTGPAAPVQPITDPGRMLPDFSAPTREQTALNKEENQLPPGLRDEETDKAEPPAIEEPAKLEAAAASAVAPAATEEQRKTAREARLAETKAHEASGIPFTITNLARKELGDLGYSPDDIKVMTPREAHIIRQQKITQPDLGKARAKFDELVSDISPAARVRPAPTVETTPAPEVGRQGPAVPPFSETEYRDAIAKLRDEGTLSHDKIGKILGVSKPQAEAYFAEMLKRNDAYPAGNYNQYAKITVPHGMATRKQHNVRGKMMPQRSRDYIVKPVRPAGQNLPYTIELDGKKLGRKGGNAFATRDEAQKFINERLPSRRRKNAAVIEDNTGLQFGIHELQYEHLPNREQRLVGEQVVNTYMTEAEAQEAIKGYDPAYSPESNKQQTQKKAPEERAAAIEQDYQREMGPIGEQLKKAGEKVLGAGRLELGIAPRIVDPKDPNAIIEGTSQDLKQENPQGIRKVVGNLIRLASDLYNPSLTAEQRAKLMEEVLNHELVHALRSLDLLTRQEWDTLFQHAANAKVPGKPYTWLQRATVRTGALEPDSAVKPNELAEEAIAEMVRHYINDPTAFRNPERGLLRKLADFIKRIMRLSDRHDAADLIDTIFEGGIADRAIGHGGLGPRNTDDIQFSLLKTDNFYLDTARFLGKVTREEAPKNDWIKMLSQAGIKPEELNWLGIKQWLEQLPKGELVHKNDIINYVQASGPKVIPVIFAKQEHPDLADAAVMGPQWDSRSQAPYGDKTYAEVAFTYPTRQGEPDYFDSGGHMMVPNARGGRDKLPNVLAFARFRDVTEKVDGDDKKILFIEEIQSDLHQQGSMKGYFSKSLRAKLDEMHAQAKAIYGNIRRMENEKNKISDEIWLLQRKEKDMRVAGGGAVTEELLNNRRQVQALMKQLVEVTGGPVAEAKAEYNRIMSEIGEGSARASIPNAPFKTNWEDYVIRRMIRHAVEHNYDGIAWHGSKESVSATEGYGELEEITDEKGRKQYLAYGETPVGPIVNRYLIRLPRITNGIAQPFGASLDHNLTPTNKQVLSHEWEPGELGMQDVEDRGRFADEVRSALPDRNVLYDMVDGIIADHRASIFNDIYHSEDDAQTAATMVEQLRTARQVAMNRRPETFDAHEVMQSSGLNDTAIKHVLAWHKGGDYYYGMDVALFGEEQKGGLTHDNYRLMFNRDMKQSFEGGEQPFFSKVRAPREILYSAAAPTGQRVPPVSPIDRLTEVHNRMTYDNLSPYIHQLIDWTVPGDTRKRAAKEAADTGIISMQDRMLSIGRLIDRMKKNGGFITNENDVYLREQLYSSQVDAHLNANDKEFYKPMLDAIKGLSVTQRDFDEAKTIDDKVATILTAYKGNHKHALAELYLYAQHAQERNVVMRRRNERVAGHRPQQYEAGSGLGDGTAQAVLDWFAGKSFAREFNDPTNDNSIRSRMRAIVKSTNDIRVAAGLTIDFRTTLHPDGTPLDPYTDYVPVRGRINEDPTTYRGDEEINKFFAKTGKGFNIRGKEDYSALGRESLGRDLIANAMLQNQESIVRAGKNKVVQSFRQLILDNPQNDWTDTAEIVQLPRTKWTYSKGAVRERQDTSLDTKPEYLKGKIDGQTFYIHMKDDRIVKAMGSKSGLGSNSGMNSLFKGMLGVNRFLAATRTSWNPEFMVANVLRDLEAAMINLSEQGRKNVRRKVMASVIPALNGVRHSLRSGNPTGEWAQVYDEFRRHGGHTAVFGIRELADTLDDMNKHLAEDVSGGPGKVVKPIRAIFKFIDDYNLAFENGTRLAAYKVLRDQYLELSGDPHDAQNQKRAREMAAFAAKNLTVNFNMGGEHKGLASAFYMFFNASMQGTLALLNPFIRSRRMKYVWASVLTAGAIQDMMMSMLSPEDEDGEKIYDKIQEHVLEHNMIFLDPFGISERGYFKLPMPYLMNGIYNFGRAASRAARGKYTAGELFSTGGMTLIDSLNPLGGSNSWLNWVAPSVIDPFVDLSMNEDFTGKPIAPVASPYGGPQENRSQQYWGNTNPFYVTVADWMSRITGREGDFIPGKVEASPNQVEYAIDWITGGTGTFLARAGRLMYGAATGELKEMELEVSDIPFVRKVTGSITTKNDLQDYIEGRDQVLRIRKALQDARKEGDDEGYRSIMRKYPKEYKIAARINAIENSRRKFSSKIKKIRDSKNLTDEVKETRIKELKARQDLLVGRGNEVLAAID